MIIKIQIISDDGEELFYHQVGELPQELVKTISLESYEHTIEHHGESVLDEIVTELINEWKEYSLNTPPIN
tara:strand:- start:205 stop:417 length:213 start_codon:yes stop_codon:yes gene_type:complete